MDPHQAEQELWSQRHYQVVLINFNYTISLLHNFIIQKRFFRAHPATRSLFPKFANVPDSALPSNPEFRAYGNTLMAALDFMLDNLDDTRVITQMLKGKNWQSYFAPGVSINQQLVVRFFVIFYSPTD